MDYDVETLVVAARKVVSEAKRNAGKVHHSTIVELDLAVTVYDDELMEDYCLTCENVQSECDCE